MTHDHHHGGTGYQILLVVLVVVDELLLDGDHYLLLHLAAHLLCDDGGGVEVNKLAQGGHDAVFHQALDHLCAGLFHAAGQLAHADLIGDLHGNGGLFDDLQPFQVDGHIGDLSLSAGGGLMDHDLRVG